MRAVRYDRYGPPDALYVADLEEPAPGPGEVKLRVRAASLNPLDGKVRAGHLRFVPAFARPPRGTGVDVAGEIVAVGSGAAPRHAGERVFGSISPMKRDGAFAEFVVAPAANIVPIPAGIDFAEAATLPVACGTAWQALAEDGRLAAGHRVLIIGAAGGVGHFAVQFAKHLGAHVVGVCSAANAEFVRDLGPTTSSIMRWRISRAGATASTSCSTRRARRPSMQRGTCSPSPAATSAPGAPSARRWARRRPGWSRD